MGTTAPAGAAILTAQHAADAETDAERQSAGRKAALTETDDLRFAVLRNAAYHNARQSWFGGLHRCIMFVTAMSGAATINAALTQAPRLAFWMGVATTAMATFDLVLGLSARAAEHARLREKVFSLLADVEECGETSEALRRCRAALTRLYGEEPSFMSAVDAVAYNTAKAAMTTELDRDDLLVVPWYWHYPLRHILPFSGTVWRKRRERRAA